MLKLLAVVVSEILKNYFVTRAAAAAAAEPDIRVSHNNKNS